MTDKIIIRNAFWYSKNGKAICIVEYVLLLGLMLFLTGWCFHLNYTLSYKAEPAKSFAALAGVGMVIFAMISFLMVARYKDSIFPCLFVWRFFKPETESLKKATKDEERRIQDRILAYEENARQAEAEAAKKVKLAKSNIEASKLRLEKLQTA